MFLRNVGSDDLPNTTSKDTAFFTITAVNTSGLPIWDELEQSLWE
jgi:hypothetical protein